MRQQFDITCWILGAHGLRCAAGLLPWIFTIFEDLYADLLRAGHKRLQHSTDTLPSPSGAGLQYLCLGIIW
jgi:hypothetical protein